MASKIGEFLSADDLNSALGCVKTLHSSEDADKDKELWVLELGEKLAKAGRGDDLATLLVDIRELFTNMAKAKTAKIVRQLLEYAATIPNSQALQVKLCEDSITWCVEGNRTFLRQRLESKLAQLYMESERFHEAIGLIDNLLKEVKKLDDKLQLVEIQLLESKVYYRLENIPRSKAALTAARSCSNSIYCPPVLQADIDSMSGVLLCHERDYKTAFSYFFEAHEGFHSIADNRALQNLKYMLMCKIMVNRPDDVYNLINTKIDTEYTGRPIDSMKEIAKAMEKRSLHEFQSVVEKYPEQIKTDEVLKQHLDELYDNMLEQHLCRIIEPFSKVEISHISELIDIDIETVTAKLSTMILDKKFDGTLDQGIGCLVIFDDPEVNGLYDAALNNFKSLNSVVDSLFERATMEPIVATPATTTPAATAAAK